MPVSATKGHSALLLPSAGRGESKQVRWFTCARGCLIRPYHFSMGLAFPSKVYLTRPIAMWVPAANRHRPVYPSYEITFQSDIIGPWFAICTVQDQLKKQVQPCGLVDLFALHISIRSKALYIIIKVLYVRDFLKNAMIGKPYFILSYFIFPTGWENARKIYMVSTFTCLIYWPC